MRDFWREIHRFLGRFLSPAVAMILIANVIVFVLFMLTAPFSARIQMFFYMLTQIPSLAVGHFCLWQFVTYMFMHFQPFHLLCNMLVLWFFAPRLEYRWGTAGFLRFYFIVGVGAGLFHTVTAYLTGHPDSPMLGASGAMYGIMLAYALHWPNDTVLLYFVVPVKIKHLMIFIGVFTFFASLSGGASATTGNNISHVTHLGGLVVAFLYLWIGKRLRRRPSKGWHPDFR
jgi:membrane associated rhomboid family serine protease